MKIKSLIVAAALSLATAVFFTAPVMADEYSKSQSDCDHSNAKAVGDPSGPTCAPHEQHFKCPDCGKEFDRSMEGTSQHSFNDGGYCVNCGWHNENASKSGDPKFKIDEKRQYHYSYNQHSHSFDCWGRCTGCGYYCEAYDQSKYPANYAAYYGYYYAPVLPVLPVLPVIPTPAVSMTNGYVTVPLGVEISNARDTANQIALANALAVLGYKNITPGATCYLYVPGGYCAVGAPQVIRYAAGASGLTPGDTAFAVYWNGDIHSTQYLPVAVDAFGNASFTAPNMTGISVVTIVKVQ